MPVPRVEVGLVIHSRMHARAPVDVWRSVRSLPDFWRLLQVRVASQFGDGLFQAGLAGALLFNPDRAADPMAIAGAFAVLFLPYSLLGPFAGALMDRWDRRWVLVGANTGRLALIAGVGNRGDQHMVSGRQLRQHRQQALVESGRVEVGQQHHQRSPPGAPQDGGNHCMPVGFDKRRSQRGHGIDQLGKQFATRGAKHAGAADPVVGQEVDMVAGS